jgi:hypothetical protein
LNPEVLLYAPDKHDNMKLVAVEYVVINTGQTAPTFDGQAFDVGGSPVPAAHWTLHVWLGKPNTNGLLRHSIPTSTARKSCNHHTRSLGDLFSRQVFFGKNAIGQSRQSNVGPLQLCCRWCAAQLAQTFKKRWTRLEIMAPTEVEKHFGVGNL